MKCTFLALLLTSLLAFLDQADGGTPAFLEVGKEYRFVYVSDTALPTQIKLLDSHAEGWLRVEYRTLERNRTIRIDESGHPIVDKPVPPSEPKQMWINIAQVAGVEESKEDLQSRH